MSKKRKKNNQTVRADSAEVKALKKQFLALLQEGDIACAGYTSLDKDPTIATACQKVAEMVGLVTWHLMENTENGDRRIKNELSRKIDINPNSYMVRADFFEAIAMNLLCTGTETRLFVLIPRVVIFEISKSFRLNVSRSCMTRSRATDTRF